MQNQKIPNPKKNKKVCTKCLVSKDVKQFNIDNTKFDKRHKNCKDCRKITISKYYLNNKNKCQIATKTWQNNNINRYKQTTKLRNARKAPYKRNWYLLNKYNISEADYLRFYKKQKGRCAICKDKENLGYKTTNTIRKLAVDHCHNTGKIRGLLCFHCNTSLGKFKDNIKLLKRAINYLQKGIKI